ncbi:MAG: hypothetical protein RIR70_2104, partial [Pseudomonadota bacterium]
MVIRFCCVAFCETTFMSILTTVMPGVYSGSHEPINEELEMVEADVDAGQPASEIIAGLKKSSSSLPIIPGFLSPAEDVVDLLKGSDGADQWRVSQDKQGDIQVTDEATGETIGVFSPSDSDMIELDLGGGDDSVTIAPEVTARLTIRGGSGDDAINGENAAAPLAVDGGEGDDHLSGGSGTDFLRGGEGGDTLKAGGGADSLYADQADITVDAGKDDDVDLIIGEGDGCKPHVSNMGSGDVAVGSDVSSAEQYLDDHPELVIEGSDEFRQATVANIGVMLGTESGKGLLDEIVGALKEKGGVLRVTESVGSGGQYRRAENTLNMSLRVDTAFGGRVARPLSVIQHELVHAYQDLVSGRPEGESTFASGETIKNVEREAVG